MTLVRYETHEGVAVITVDNPPVNALSPGVPGGIIESLKQADICLLYTSDAADE